MQSFISFWVLALDSGIGFLCAGAIASYVWRDGWAGLWSCYRSLGFSMLRFCEIIFSLKARGSGVLGLLNGKGSGYQVGFED